ncbi:hypothetical protein ARMGADRAFT_1077667 [Armillaria gallica]|uniref:Uncharacterized protein n=1 Tax=Armillaria gallica TaxID=47427 RepID=A0A2H3DQK8_ARMGA|nr:hypothetical protein ARMGADRAFT_1077667 [Armillaria gallica]
MEVPQPGISQDDKSVVFDELDLTLNCLILESLLQGLYTGIIVVTLWTMFSSPKCLRSTFLRTIIILLYVLRTIVFVINWAFQYRGFIEYGDNYYSVFTALQEANPWYTAHYLVSAITGGISTLLVDTVTIWRCWILWDRQWRVILTPILCTVVGTVMKTMQILSDLHNFTDDIRKSARFAAEINWSLIYILMTLATTVVCIILITYRIVRLAHRISSFRSIITTLIETSATYSLVLVVYLALVAKNLEAAYYADLFAAYVRAIAPTLLVLRVAATSDSGSSNEERTTSRDFSVIWFTKRMDESSCDDIGGSSVL